MKKVTITTAALAIAFGLSPYAGAQTVDNGSAAASDHSKAAVKTKIYDSYNDKTIYKGKAKNDESPFGAAANNHSTATTSLQLSLTDAFNKSTVVNATKLDGYVSGNRIDHVGNYGGNAYNYGNDGGRGGDGGYASAKAHSGKAYSYGGDGGYAKGGRGGYAEANGGSAVGGAGSTSNGTNGGTANGGTGSPANGGTNTGNTTNGATDWEAGNATGGNGGTANGGNGGTANGGNGGAGGSATSGYATADGGSAYGGNGGRGGDAYGGSAGTFNASNTLSGLTGAAGVTVAIQNTGMASLQQVGVTTMANVSISH